MIKVGIVGGTGYTGVELLRLLAQHPEARRARDHVAQGRRDARSPTCSRACAAATTLAFVDPGEAPISTACDVVFFATPHGVAMAQARELVGAGVQDHRPRRRFPAHGPGGVRALVQDAARVPGPARRVGLRPARDEPRRDPQGAHRRQSRLLSDRRAARLPAAARSGRRRHRAPDRRLQVGRVGRRPQGRAGPVCSPRPPTTSRRTASRATATIPEIVQGLNRAQQDAGDARRSRRTWCR